MYHTIDTLYLSFRPLDRDHYYFLLSQMTKKTYVSLGEAGGYMWHDYGDYRFGIAAYDWSLRTNNPPFRLQFAWHVLKDLDPTCPEFSPLLPFGSLSDWDVVRVDINHILPADRFPVLEHSVDPFRSGTVVFKGSSDEIETVYKGSRSGGCVLRVYRKDIEMRKNDDFAKLDYYGGDPLTTFELEMRRKFLQRRFGRTDVTLADWESIYRLYLFFAESVRFFAPSHDNLTYYRARHYDKIVYAWSISDIADEVFLPTPALPRSAASWSHARNRLIKIVNSYADHAGISAVDVINRLALYMFAGDESVGEVIIDLADKFISQPSFDYYDSNFRFYFDSDLKVGA